MASYKAGYLSEGKEATAALVEVLYSECFDLMVTHASHSRNES